MHRNAYKKMKPKRCKNTSYKKDQCLRNNSLSIVSMGMQRNDDQKRKPKLKKDKFHEKKFSHKIFLNTTPIGVHMNDIKKKLELEYIYTSRKRLKGQVSCSFDNQAKIHLPEGRKMSAQYRKKTTIFLP